MPDGQSAFVWAAFLACVPLLIALGLDNNFYVELTLLGGLLLFGVIFAINSSLHSFLIIHYASENAMGRLIRHPEIKDQFSLFLKSLNL